MATIYVPGKVVEVRAPGTTYVQRKWQPAHYADSRTGAWVGRPGSRGRTGSVTVGGGGGARDPNAFDPNHPYTWGTYSGPSDADLQSQAHSYAAAQIAAQVAAIQRQQAAAAAQAARDEETYKQLGQAQMGMIGQIPANVQNIQNTAAAAMSSWGSQIAGAQQQQAKAEQAANAQFSASQLSGTPAASGGGAAPAPSTDGGAPAPGSAAANAGVNAAGAAAATQAMGGTMPAQQAIMEGQSAATYAAGMPAVVARATQEQVAQRMAQAAATDADYRQQLVDAAAQEGGIYMDAYQNLVQIDNGRYSRWEAGEQHKQDAWQAQYNAWKDQRDYALQRWQTIENVKLAGGRLTLAQQKEQNQLAHQLTMEGQGQTRLDQGQQRIRLANRKQAADAARYSTSIDASASRVAGHLVNKNGDPILDKNGKQIPIAKTPKAGPKSDTPGGGRGIKVADQMAKDFRGPPRRSATQGGVAGTIPNDPKVDYGRAFIQIRDRLIGMGYKRPEAEAIAHNALNTYYGTPYRPGKQGGTGRPKKK